MADSKARILELRRELERHNYNYYVANVPDIPDQEYDRMFQELVKLEAANPALADPNSPTARIGHALPSTFTKVKHPSKMLSLDNAFTADEVLGFFTVGTELTVEPKIDGLSLELTYEKGALVRAATRGDGTVGGDVTANARTIRNIPLHLPQKLSLRVRGEVYMPLNVFTALNQEARANDEEEFANARNAASGSMLLKDSREVARRKLAFVAYSIPDELEGVTSQTGITDMLERLGFQSVTMLPTVHSMQLPPQHVDLGDDVVAMQKLIADMDAYRKGLNLDTDGLVFKVNDLSRQRDLGDGTRAPKWAVAFKYPPERKARSCQK
jgi:DNA ligase (NAD+)